MKRPERHGARPAGLISVEAEHGGERFVNAPHLLGGHVAHQVAEPLGVDGADLLDEDAAPLARNVDLGPKRRRPGSCGRWGQRSPPSEAGTRPPGRRIRSGHRAARGRSPSDGGSGTRHPRSTKRFREAGDLEHLLTVLLVVFEGCHLGRQFLTTTKPPGSREQSRADGIRARHPRRLQRPQRLECLVVAAAMMTP